MPDDPNRRVEQDANERGRVAADQLSRVNGPLELHAAVLALLLPPGSKRALRAWEIECQAHPHSAAQALRAYVAALPAAARLPWFEAMLARLRNSPLPARQAMLEATRRLMGARGTVRPIDRLHWLVMRLRLGETLDLAAPAGAGTSMSQLPQADVHAIAMFSAFLSRMVPVAEPAVAGAQGALAAAAPSAASAGAATPSVTSTAAPSPTPGAAWYASVMAPWAHLGGVPPLALPDTDGIVYALQALQALAWMQRPVLVRGWVTAARQHSRHGRLSDSAADALRLSCALLDSPMPPELARHYSAANPEAPA
jgi:hypothetical protein